MRILFTSIIIIFVTTVSAQTPFAGNFENATYRSALARNRNIYDSGTQKKWFISRYTGITTGYNFFGRGSAGFIAAPVGLQLNRRLSNNIYAFAGVAVAPTYINFNHAFPGSYLNGVKTGSGFYQPGNFSMPSAATLGLMYINNEKTFSVSGSISVERSNYPFYYNNQLNTARPTYLTPANRQ